MAPAAGRPFIEWIVRFLAKEGVREVLISTGYMAETIEKHFDDTRIGDLSVRCYAEPAPLGTAGGFLNAIRASGKNARAWLVMNGDSLLLGGLNSLFRATAEEGASGAVLGRRMTDASRYGTMVADAEGRLITFSEKRPGEGTINAGIYLLRSSLLSLFPNELPQNFEQDVFPRLIASGANIQVASIDAPFLDIGTEETLKQAEGFILQNKSCFLDS
jgi:D-glycero-alpha-D-manno-heptose 1-phosphate guanylyltransferase